MRILQACPYSWHARGGVQAHVAQLARELTARGHVVAIVAPGHAGRPCPPNVHLVGSPVRVPFNGSIAPTCLDPRVPLRLWRVMRAFRPDIVHVHEPFASFASGFAAALSPAPVVATFHAALDRRADMTSYRALARLVRFVRRRLDECVAVSEVAAETARLGIGNALRVVPNGTDIDAFREAPRARTPAGRSMLFVGRLERRKGFDVALEAFVRLAGAHADLSLIVVGEGSDPAPVRRLDEAVRRRVVMMGGCSDRALIELYRSADVFIAPSLGGESFGMVLLDAAAAGLPLVASDIPGFRQIVTHDENGLLVPPGDAASLAGAVERVLADGALARRLAEEAGRRAEALSWARIAPRLESVYGCALEGTAVAAPPPWTGRRPTHPPPEPSLSSAESPPGA